MSTAHVDMARSPFSSAAFAQLVRRLRHASARYNQIASQFRCRIRPTHHAKWRAYRAGLRIDTSKARACPTKYVSTLPPPVLDMSGVTPSSAGPPTRAYATGATGLGHGAAQGDACMRRVPLRNLPEAVVRRSRRRDGRQRVVLRLPPLRLSLNIDYACETPFQGPVPGAPRLLPRQLPEDEYGMEEMMLGSASSSSSSTGAPDALLTPLDVKVYSGLCITIPPRGVKRKLQDVEVDGSVAPPQQLKRVLMTRWSEAQGQ